ncbi:DUF1232 domain-containing protein [Stakelama sp. CBK3Z-3]|uniref:DUF1232 domain-containing protein n=1 Tax=Stakelama flava TaxID=2860338 RepID=A0ABS6XPH1_9SPHN|nr:YkvA family protein [Stakelama flava]MBW4331678.1 DUF1232 domain-containing protein [Stakelama flava]
MGPSLVHRLHVEAHAVWLAVRDPRTPLPARLVGVFVAAYALSPIDLIPDFIPLLGVIDDIILIPAGLWLFERMVPDTLLAEHRAVAERETRRPRSGLGLVIVLAIWALVAWIAWGYVATRWD